MRRAALYLWSVNIVGAAVIVAALVEIFRYPLGLGWLIPGALAVISGFLFFRMKSVAASFSIGDVFSLAALFVYGPAAATLTVALDTIGISMRLKGPLPRIIFNTAAPSLAMWCAGMLVFRVIGAPLPVNPHQPLLPMFTAAFTAVVISFLLGSAFVATAVALHQNLPIARVWREHFAQLWTGPAAGGYVGVLVALFTDRLGLAAFISLLPIPLILYYAYRNALGRVEDEVSHLIAMKTMYQATIQAFATAVDAKDHVTAGAPPLRQRVPRETACISLSDAMTFSHPALTRPIRSGGSPSQ